MGGTRIKLKGFDLSRSNNVGRTSMLVFSAASSATERSLRKSQMLTTWSPQRVRYLREHENEPRSMLCAYFKSHCQVNGGYL